MTNAKQATAKIDNGLIDTNHMTPAERADYLNKVDAETKENAKAARYLPTLYGFNPEEKGMLGYSRIPNLFFELQSQFLAINLATRESVLDKDGNKKWTIKLKTASGEEEVVPAPLDMLDTQILLYALSLYQRKGLSVISFSQKDVARMFGKSDQTIHRAVKKLVELGYLVKLNTRIGVSGGHVRQYNMKPFRDEFLRLALNYKERMLMSRKEEIEMFGF